ncbi:MAG: hypothetical protein K5876_00980 [Ruminiclostridium sp.]|nr:hypothetical protein [Ruminiclostridium sp.]
MKRYIKFIYAAFIMLLSALILSVTVSANSAMLPDLTVMTSNLTDRRCYVTLITDIGNDHIAPYRMKPYLGETNNIDLTFAGYAENTPDLHYNGWYNLIYDLSRLEVGVYAKCGKFQLIAYFPDTGNIVAGDIIEPYAIESRFTAEITENGITIASGFDPVYNIITLAVRIIVTVTLELLIALMFRFSGKKQLLTILVVNFITQAGLNIGMNAFHVLVNDTWSLIIYYWLLEHAVFITEAVVYYLIFNKLNKSDKRVSGARCTAYALVANIVSFAASPLIAALMNGTF